MPWLKYLRDSPVGRPLLVAFLVLVFGGLLFSKARDLEAGTATDHDAAGRRERSLDRAAAFLGTTGSLLVWLGGLSACAVWFVIACHSRPTSPPPPTPSEPKPAAPE